MSKLLRVKYEVGYRQGSFKKKKKDSLLLP